MCTWECVERYYVSLSAVGHAGLDRGEAGPGCGIHLSIPHSRCPSRGTVLQGWGNQQVVDTSLSKGEMEIDSCRPRNAFHDLRPWGQKNLHGDVLPRQPSSQKRIKRVAFGGFHSEVKQQKKQAGDHTE